MEAIIKEVVPIKNSQGEVIDFGYWVKTIDSDELLFFMENELEICNNE